MLYKFLDFPVFADPDGCLVPLEVGQHIPFSIERVYYIWGTQREAIRGRHAHRKLEQVIVCMAGSCQFILDDGARRERVLLDTPTRGLYLRHNIWREFTNFSPDCVIMVLASEHYDESDYIRDYDEFVREVRAGTIHD